MPDLDRVSSGFPDDATLRRVHANVLRFVAKRLPPGIDAQDVVADVLLSFASFRGENLARRIRVGRRTQAPALPAT